MHRICLPVVALCALAACAGDDVAEDDADGPATSGAMTDSGGPLTTASASDNDDASGTAGGDGTTSGMTSASEGTVDGTADGTTDDDTADTADTADATTDGPVGNGGAFEWVANEISAHDYGQRLALPDTFGEGEFSFQVWIKPDDSYPVGPAADDILNHWANEDEAPYGSGQWWYRGNFLLDGHNNISSFSEGTFSLQFYGGGRVRWLLGDGTSVLPSGEPLLGGVLSAGVHPADATPSLVNGNWHQLTLVRRWSGADQADLELWIDGALVDTQTSTARTNMRQYWDDWAGFGGEQDGWFWGAEKQAAIGVLDQYEDYKGLMAEVRFWDIALTDIESTYADPVDGTEPGLVGHVPWNEGSGQQACDVITGACATLYLTDDTQWVQEGPPLTR